MKGGTLFSGIGAPEVAAPWVDWRWAAEIDPFASTVHKHRFPHITNLGDITAVDWKAVEPVDLIVAGPPCQDHSVAGKRAGLSGERGNLSLVYAEALDAIDPLWSLTENVPGWLSLGDNAFGAFLGQLVGADAALVPGRGQRWTDAGVVDGPRRTAAWRVLDAQFFGVAQRRRRVFVLAVRGSGNWACAAALFPLVQSMYWDSPPRREARQGAAAPASLSAPDGGGERVAPTLDSRQSAGGAAWGTDFLADGGMAAPDEVARALLGRHNFDRGDAETLIAGCLQERDAKGADSDTKPGHLIPVPELADPITAHEATTYTHEGTTFRMHNLVPGVADPLLATGRDASPDGTGHGFPIVPAFNSTGHGWWNEGDTGATVRSEGGEATIATLVAFSAKDDGDDAVEEIAPTLRAMEYDGSHANGGGQIAVAETVRSHPRPGSNALGGTVAVPLLEVSARTGREGHEDVDGLGVGEPGDPMFTLQSGHQHGVAYGLRSDAARSGEARSPSADAEGRVRLRDPGFNFYEETSPTIDAGQPHAVAYDVTGTGPGVRTGAAETAVHVALRARTPGASEGSTTTVIGVPDPAFALSAGKQDEGGVFGSGRDGQDTYVIEQPVAVDLRNGEIDGQMTMALQGGGIGHERGMSINSIPHVAVDLRNGAVDGDTAMTVQSYGKGSLSVNSMPHVVAHTLDAASQGNATEDGTGRGVPLVAVALDANYAKGPGERAGIERTVVPVEVTHTLDAASQGKATEDGTGRGVPLAVVPPLMARSSRGSTQGLSTGFTTDGHVVPVPEPIAFDPGQITNPMDYSNPAPGVCHTLQSRTHTPTIAVRTAQTSANGHGVAEDVAHTLDRAQGQAVAFNVSRNERGNEFVHEADVAKAVDGSDPTSHQGGTMVAAFTISPGARKLKDDIHVLPADTTKTLDGTGPGPTSHQGGTLIAQAFKPSHYTRDKDGAPSELVPPLSADADKGDQDTLIALDWQNSAGGPNSEETFMTLTQDRTPAVTMVFDTTQITHPANRSRVDPGGPSPALAKAGHAPTVALAQNQRGELRTMDVMPSLSAERGGKPGGDGYAAVATLAVRGRGDGRDLETRDDGTANAILTPNGGRDGMGVGAVAFRTNHTGRDNERLRVGDGISHTLEQDHAPAVAFNITPSQSNKDYNARPTERAQALTSGGNRPSARGGDLVAPPAMTVRRLTPREAERLQGFPDDFTLIPYRGKAAADGPRYRALGNSMAVPCIAWLLRRVREVE